MEFGNATTKDLNTSSVAFDFSTTGFDTTNTSTTTQEDTISVYDYDEYWVSVYINKHYLYVITGLGLPGNIAAIVTLCKIKPLTSSSLYMVMLSIVDSFNLIVKLLYLDLTKYDVQLGHIGCKLMFFTGTFLMHYSNWILVAMTIERFLAIWFPLRVVELCTRRRAIMVMVLIAFLLAALDLHFLWSTFEGWSDYYKWNCEFDTAFFYFMAKIWYWIDGAAYSFLPFMILIIFNTLIIIGIRRQQSRMKSKIDKTKMTEKMKQQQQVTIMLVTVSVVFVILTVPNCAFFIIQNYWNYNATVRDYANYFLLYQIVFVLSDLNHAINFYLYFLSGRKFRERFRNMICCRTQSVNRFRGTTVSYMTASTRTQPYAVFASPSKNTTNACSRTTSEMTKLSSLGSLQNVIEHKNNVINSEIDLKMNGNGQLDTPERPASSHM